MRHSTTKKAFLALALALLLIPSAALAAYTKVGVITAVKGKATAVRENRNIPIQAGTEIMSVDMIRTEAEARVTLKMNDGAVITVGPSSKIYVKKYEGPSSGSSGRTILGLMKGIVRSVTGTSKYEVHTPTAVAAARGTDFRVIVIDEGGKQITLLAVTVGEVDLSNLNRSQWAKLVKAGFMSVVEEGKPPVEPKPIDKAVMEKILKDTSECGLCQTEGEGGTCANDDTQDPGPCYKCEGGKAVPDDAEQTDTCQKCENGRIVPDNSQDPGQCKKCDGGKAVNDPAEDPGQCKKCENGEVVNDSAEDPGQCKKCDGGEVVNDSAEDPGQCKKCDGGEVVNDSAEDPGQCKKCENGAVVNDSAETPGPCKKCENMIVANDPFYDPGACKKCEGGSIVPDDFKNIGLGECEVCRSGLVVNNDSAVVEECYSCKNRMKLPDDTRTCNDANDCTTNDRCISGQCIGAKVTTTCVSK